MARRVDPEKHEARRLQILDAAALCFARTGFEGTTTAAVCRQAGIGSGTLFHYFPTKRALFAGIFELDAVEQAAARQDALALPDPRAGLHLLLERLTAYAHQRDYLGLVYVAVERALRDPEFAAGVEQTEQATRAALVTLLEGCRAQGLGDPGVGPEIAAGWLQQMADLVYFRLAGDPELDPAVETATLRLLVDRWLG